MDDFEDKESYDKLENDSNYSTNNEELEHINGYDVGDVP